MRRLLLTVLVATSLSACGTTVQQTGLPATAGAGADGLSVVPGGQVPGPDGTVGAPGGGTEPGAVGAVGGTGGGVAGGGGAVPGAVSGGGGRTGSGGSTAPGAGAPAAGGRSGPGVTADKVRIGFQYVDVGSGTGGVIGQDVSLGDPVAQARAVEKFVNDNGGLGGRTMEVVPYGAPYSGYVNNPQGEYAKVCTYYTQDQKVFGVAVYVPDETLIDCLAKRDVVTVADGYSMDRQVHDRYSRYYYAPGSMSQDRGAEVGVEGLVANGFLKGAKIGLVRYETGVYQRAEVSLRGALARKGLKIQETFQVSASDTSSATRDVGAAVLRFAALGITHVMFLDNSGGIAYTFMSNAEPQQYRPFYALTTNNSPQALKNLAPARQLEKAQAVSWWWGDVGTEVKEETPPAVPRARDLCLKIMADEGVDLSASAAKGSALITCDQLLFFKTLFDRAASPSSEALEQAADRLGTGYSSTLSYRTTIARGRHDGATVTRVLRFDAACGCWRYSSPGPTA